MTVEKAILVLSGKGGVGKTLISVNIALALRPFGTVGLLDADFSASNSSYFLDMEGKMVDSTGEIFTPAEYSGSQPQVEGSENEEAIKVDGDVQVDEPVVEEVEPIPVNVLKVFSIPLVLGEKAVTMDGSQQSQFLRDAIVECNWDVEYLVVDMPAGFGDQIKAAANILQNVLLGSIIVVQPAHELDAIRAIRLHKDLGLPILGLIENMSYFQAGAIKWKVFGESVVDHLGEKFDVRVFGKIPLSMEVRERVERKQPILPESCIWPIIAATEEIIVAKPTKPGFLARVKQWLQGTVEEVLFQMALSMNREINIPEAMQKYGYPGGAVIRLNIMDEAFARLIYQADWIITNGRMTVIESADNYKVDTQIDITPGALKNIFLKNTFNDDGSLYTFDDALRLGHMKIYGDRSMARGAYFMKNVFLDLQENEGAMSKMRPALEVL